MNKLFVILAYMVFGVSYAWANSPEDVSDLDVVAACLILEAGGEGEEGLIAVLNVIDNRADRRNKSRREICLQKWQFSCFNSYTVKKEETLHEIVARAKKHSKWDLAFKLVLCSSLRDITDGADHYYACYIDPPWWTEHMRKTVKIGRHIFYDSRK